MGAERIYQVLKSRKPRTLARGGYTRAAVLVPIQERASGEHLILTQRAEGLSHHGGQVAFPGGRVDPEDSGNLEAALREAEEEVGLDPAHVRILGQLDEITSAYGYLVTPFVGAVPSPYEFRLNHTETAAVFAVPIQALLEPGCYATDGYFDSARRHPVEHFYYGGWDIWGATARILRQFLELAYDFKPNGA